MSCPHGNWGYCPVCEEIDTAYASQSKTIEQLTARVRELEEENARLKRTNSSYANLTKAQESQLTNLRQRLYQLKSADSAIDSERQANCELTEQLAASQLHAEQLRGLIPARTPGGFVTLGKNYMEAEDKFNDPYSEMCKFKRVYLDKCEKALALPADTSALDAYVAKKVKEATPDFRQMREMLRAMQAGEITVSRGIEILDMWHAGNWNDNMLPPVRQDLIEEDSMPVEIIDRCNQQIATLTRQRDLAVDALEKQGHSAGCRKNAFGDICTCGLDDLLSTIKGSEK